MLSQGMGDQRMWFQPSSPPPSSIRPLPAPQPPCIAYTPRLDVKPHLTDSRPGRTPERESSPRITQPEKPPGLQSPTRLHIMAGGGVGEKSTGQGVRLVAAQVPSTLCTICFFENKKDYRLEQLEVHRKLSGRYRDSPSLPRYQQPPPGHSLRWMTLE